MEHPSNQPMSRRKFLTFLGTGAATLAASSSGLGLLLGGAAPARAADRLFAKQSGLVSSVFQPVKPTTGGQLELAAGLRFQVLARCGDKLNAGGAVFGTAPSWSAFLPIDGSAVHGLLVVGHDAPAADSSGAGGWKGHLGAGEAQAQLAQQGASVLEVYRNLQGEWVLEPESAYTRRITGLERAELTGPARQTAAVRSGGTVQGTVAQQDGLVTPWNTVLSGEGGFDGVCRDTGLAPTHYGWVTEADPFDPRSAVRKHTALGRFRHSGMALRVSGSGRLVVYMGDGSEEACLYKYVSRGSYQAARGAANAELLTDGTLYAADLTGGVWLPLTLDAVRERLESHAYQPPAALQRSKEALLPLFREPGDVLVHAYEAAMILDASRLDPVGGVQLHPDTHAVYVSVGSCARHGSVHGYIARLDEADGDAEATTFAYDVFSAGGPGSRFRAPGPSVMETNGSLWVASNTPAAETGVGAAASFGNNGLYMLSTAAHTVNSAVQFASAPAGARLSAPAFNPDGRTVFLTVRDDVDPARSCLVAITG